MRESKENRGNGKFISLGVTFNFIIVYLGNLLQLGAVNPWNINLDVEIIQVVLLLLCVLQVHVWFVKASDLLNAYDVVVINAALEDVQRQVVFIDEILNQVSWLGIGIQIRVWLEEQHVLRQRQPPKDSFNVTTRAVVSISAKNLVSVVSAVQAVNVVIESNVIYDVLIFLVEQAHLITFNWIISLVYYRVSDFGLCWPSEWNSLRFSIHWEVQGHCRTIMLGVPLICCIFIDFFMVSSWGSGTHSFEQVQQAFCIGLIDFHYGIL